MFYKQNYNYFFTNKKSEYILLKIQKECYLLKKI